MMKNKNNNISQIKINTFLIIALIIISLFKIASNSPVIKQSENPIRKLISGSDIVRQINEQCVENTNILKYNIIINSTAFLLNLNASTRRNLYSSISELNGKNIGVERGKTYADLINTNFPLSSVQYEESTTSLIMSLLQGKIEAFLLEEPVANYYSEKMPSLTYFKDKIANDNYGFGYSNIINSKIINEFDEYLTAIKKDGSYNDILKIWTGELNSLKKIDKDLNGANGVIKAGFNLELPPFSYSENGENLGFEIDLLYRFAKLYGYRIEITSLTTQEQLNKIMSNNIDLIGGCISINEQRKLFMNFSTAIYEGGTVVVIRNDNIKESTNKNDLNQKKVIVKNQYGTQNLGNTLNFPVNGLPDGQSRVGTCIFPEILSEIYSFECTISGLTENNPMVNGFTYGLITDYIEVNGIILNQIYSYIPSHILGENKNSDIEHPGTICPKMNAYLAGVDNIEEILNKINFGFGIYRKSVTMPKTIANLYLRKGSNSCQASCQEEGNNIVLNSNNYNSINVLVRYSCSCTFLSTTQSDYFYADFDTIKFKYLNNEDKVINMDINNKEMIKSAMSNLNKNVAKYPSDLKNLNTFVVSNLINGRCLKGKFTFNAIGFLYKTISQEQFFVTNYPIRSDFILKIPYDLEQAEIQISINAKVRGVLMIRKDYYENQNNKGEYLYLTSKKDVTIQALYCEGNIVINGNNSNYTANNAKEKVETITLRDEMSIPKWLIILFVLLIAFISIIAIYYYIEKIDNDVQYVIKYKKNNSTNINIIPPK